MLTDVPGVLDAHGQLIPELSIPQVHQAIADGVITGGMIPKVENCVEAVQHGVRAAVILDGRQPHACLLEMFTEGGIGTLIRG
jgi:acetylglutamate kinase